MTTNLLAAFGKFLDKNRSPKKLVEWTDLTLALWRYKEQLAYNLNNISILKILFSRLRLAYLTTSRTKEAGVTGCHRVSDTMGGCPKTIFLTTCDTILDEDSSGMICREINAGAYENTKDIEIAIDEICEFFFGESNSTLERNVDQM